MRLCFEPGGRLGVGEFAGVQPDDAGQACQAQQCVAGDGCGVPGVAVAEARLQGHLLAVVRPAFAGRVRLQAAAHFTRDVAQDPALRQVSWGDLVHGDVQQLVAAVRAQPGVAVMGRPVLGRAADPEPAGTFRFLGGGGRHGGGLVAL